VSTIGDELVDIDASSAEANPALPSHKPPANINQVLILQNSRIVQAFATIADLVNEIESLKGLQ
jgi:hypothetical protein